MADDTADLFPLGGIADPAAVEGSDEMKVAHALLDRKRLTHDQVIDTANFTTRLCSPDWLEDTNSK